MSFTFALTGDSLAEGAPALAVEVVLHTTLPALVDPASIDVADAGGGSATSGSDYAVFATQTLTFPAGSLDGDAQTVSLGALDDLLVEAGDESARLRLQAPVGGAISGTYLFTATITNIHSASIAFAAAASTTTNEASGARTVALELDTTPPGAELASALAARVSDLAAGSATPGADYSAFPAQNVTFPIGSADGALRTVAVQVIDDPTIESDETVELALAPVSGSAIGATNGHEFTIQDDDALGVATLVASAGATGLENSLVYDEALDLGSETVDEGPNEGILVRLMNGGGTPLALGAPSLTGPDEEDFAVEIDSAAVLLSAAELGVPAPDAHVPLVARAPDGGPGIALSVDRVRLRELAPLGRATLHGLVVPDLGAVTLDLRRLPLPVAEDALLHVDGVAITGGPRALLGDLQLWGGSVLELPGSRVFLALSSAGASGYLDLATSARRHVQVMKDGDGGARIVRDGGSASLASSVPPDFCQEPLVVPGRSERTLAPDAGSPGTSALTVAGCRLALETDYQLFQDLGSSGEVTTYVTQMIAAIGDQYFVDVQTRFTIAYLGIHTTAADGWEAQETPGATPSTLLNEFKTTWDAGWPAQADLAHFLSGQSLGGGVAYLDVLCEPFFGYGVSANLNGNIDWATWTGQPGNFTWDFMVVAHELGHNFGSSHTHSYCPPLDQCYDNCVGTQCTQGTIMSYCHMCGGMDNIDLRFHPYTANIMRQAVNASCLGESALGPGDFIQYLVRFNPLTTAGARSSALQFPHDASNVTQPFRVQLSGTAGN